MLKGASVGAAAVLLLIGSCAVAQSLGEVARQQRTQKSKAARQQHAQKGKSEGKTFTNEDLSALPRDVVSQPGTEPAQKPPTEVGEASPAQRTSIGNPSAEKRTAGTSNGPQAFRYTVSWAPIPDVMNAAVFRFTVPALASGDGTVPLAKIEIIGNPCTDRQPADPSPQLYATSRLHIYLACAGLKKVGLARLIGQLSPTVDAPRHYAFQAVLGYYASPSFFLAVQPGLGAVPEGRLTTTGTLEIEPVSTAQ